MKFGVSIDRAGARRQFVEDTMNEPFKPPSRKQCKLQPIATGILIGVFAVVSGIAFAASPRDELAARGIKFTPDVFVEQAGAGEIETVWLFLAAGMDVNARECCEEPLPNAGKAWGQHHASSEKARGHKTALIAAAERGHLAVVRLLLKHGADVNARNNSHDTGLRLAARGGHTEIVRLLLESGADVNARNPLISAAFNGHVEIARLLISHKAQLNPVTSSGQTPLHWAATLGHVELVRLLIRHNADVNARTKAWSIETPLDRARDPEIIRLLRAAGGKRASELR